MTDPEEEEVASEDCVEMAELEGDPVEETEAVEETDAVDIPVAEADA